VGWWLGGCFFLSGWRQELGWGVSWSLLMVEVQREGLFQGRKSCWVGFRVSREGHGGVGGHRGGQGGQVGGDGGEG